MTSTPCNRRGMAGRRRIPINWVFRALGEFTWGFRLSPVMTGDTSMKKLAFGAGSSQHRRLRNGLLFASGVIQLPWRVWFQLPSQEVTVL
jgi:hypothetical protein